MTLCGLISIVILHRVIIHGIHARPKPAPNPYFSTGDPASHNAQTIKRLTRCRSLGLLRDSASPHLEPLSPEEEARRHDLGCGTNQTTLIILPSLWMSEALIASTTGEAIYAQSAISTFNYWGYAYVFTSHGWYNHGMDRTLDIWREWRIITRTVLADPEQVDECYARKGAGECLESKDNPGGIPGWKLLSFWYWDE